MLQGLRNELSNLLEITGDLEDEQNKSAQKSTTTTNSILSASKNANFLNQELMFFVSQLQEKALKSGLNENALLPSETAKDRNILKFLKLQNDGDTSTRPQSATGNSSAMRSSFYSMQSRDSDDAGLLIDDAEIQKRNSLVKQLNIANILELSQRDR